MGMFDTVHFDRPIVCAVCQAPILSAQTKAFECLMDSFRVGDCISHAEEIRLVREGLYCDACHTFDKQFVYFVVYRGILIDVTPDRETAEAQLRTFSFERLLLWYHDLYAKCIAEQRDRRQLEHFLRDVVSWYEEGYDQLTSEERDKRGFLFWLHRPLLEKAATPLDALRAYFDQLRADDEATSDTTPAG